MLIAAAVSLTALILGAPSQATPRDSAPTAPGVAVIRGRVLAASGDPIRKALVVVAEVGKDPDVSPVFTDAQGRFAFTALPPARYVVTASKPGYVTTRFGSRGPFDPPAIVSAADGLVDGIDLTLARAAAIGGHVLDESGEPLLGMALTASRIVRSNGHARLLAARSAQTDDLGEYRLSGLAPGSYVVTLASEANVGAAMVTLAGAIIGVRGEATTSWQPLYYPSTPNISQAEPLILGTGQEIGSIDFTAKPERSTRVSVQITNPGALPRLRGFNFLSDSPIEVVREGGILGAGVGEAETHLLPGEWVLYVPPLDGFSALSRVTVGDADMSVPVTLTKDPRISGRVVFKGRTAPAPGRVLLQAWPSGLSPALARAVATTVAMNATGAFELDAFSGPVEFSVFQAPAGWTLESVSLKGRVLADTTANLQAGETITDAQIILTNQPAAITGTAVDPSGAEARGYSVIVFPDGPAGDNLERLSRWVKPDQSGRFWVSDLPPGDYLAIALEEVDDAQWSTDAYLQHLRGRATRVTLSAGKRPPLVLTVGGSR